MFASCTHTSHSAQPDLLSCIYLYTLPLNYKKTRRVRWRDISLPGHFADRFYAARELRYELISLPVISVSCATLANFVAKT